MGFTRLGVVATAVCLVASCTGQGSPNSYVPRRPRGSPTSSHTILIGLVGTMSGRDEWRGTDAFEGAHFGLGALNRNVDDQGVSFELITRDDRGDPERAAALIEELALDDRYAGVVYAGPTEGLPHAETVLESAGIPAVLCYGDLYTARLLRSNLFQVAPPFSWEAQVIASYIARDRRYKRTGALVERSLDGKTAKSSLQASLTSAGLRRALVRSYDPDQAQFRSELAELRSERVEAVVVQGSPTTFDRVVSTLRAMRAAYKSTAAARFASARPGADLNGKPWRPQVVGLDSAIHPSAEILPPGTVAADSYERGLSYLPVPSFRAFKSGFVDWWGHSPLGWQIRAYEAVQMIGWAKLRTDDSEETDVAATLEGLHDERFGGLDIWLSSVDHLAAERSTIGLWTIPRKGIPVPERSRLPASLPWVPIARTFTTDGTRTLVPPSDWTYLYRGAKAADRPPRFDRMRFGVVTTTKDPVH